MTAAIARSRLKSCFESRTSFLSFFATARPPDPNFTANRSFRMTSNTLFHVVLNMTDSVGRHSLYRQIDLTFPPMPGDFIEVHLLDQTELIQVDEHYRHPDGDLFVLCSPRVGCSLDVADWCGGGWSLHSKSKENR